MKKRTKARISAMKILYARDVTADPAEECFRRFWETEQKASESLMKYSEKLVMGVEANRKDIDAVIAENADNWRIERMAVVDRNILRVAVFELLHMSDIPPKVTINEAIDIAKEYGNADSGKFVNGILDRILRMKCPVKHAGAKKRAKKPEAAHDKK